jgi:hypothetical protein
VQPCMQLDRQQMPHLLGRGLGAALALAH